MPISFAHSELVGKFFVRCQRNDIRDICSHDANMAGSGTFGGALRAVRKRREWSLEQMAAELGTSKSYLSELERDKRPMPPGATLEKWAEALKVQIADLVPQAATSETVPVVGYVSAGDGVVLFAEGQGPLDYVEPPRNARRETVAVEVRGISLGPAFDDALIFYDDVRSPVTEDLFGRLCVVGTGDGKVLVKILRPASEGRFHLLSNTAEPPILDAAVQWAARVKEIRPR